MAALRLIVAVILGLVVGSMANMALVLVGGEIMAPPSGADMTNTDGVNAALPQMEARHFLFPFLAHAIGTLVGAFVAAKIATQHKLPASMAIGALFFVGGVMASRMIPAPTWFIALDLIVAYFPLAWLGYWLARPRQQT
jgi:NADH:ubiquinone oxidoreductase subunit 4 (subunit M)